MGRKKTVRPTVTLIDHARKAPREFYVLSSAEVRAGAKVTHVRGFNDPGRAFRVRQNGMLKTWKRDALRFELPLKYGLYEAFRVENRDADNGRLLTPVDGEAWL